MKFGKTVLTLCLAAVLAVAVLPFSRPAAAASMADVTVKITSFVGELRRCDPSAEGELVITHQNGEIKKIANRAFEGCTALTRVVIPEGVTYIGGSAFLGCTALESIVLPESLETIDYAAFSGCTALKEIHIPKGVKSIAQNAFQGCTALTAFSLDKENTRFREQDGVLYSLSGMYLSFYPMGRPDAAFTVPDGVEIIKENAFQGALKLEKVTFPGSLREIGKHAFFECANLKEIVMPEKGMETIGTGAFKNCALLTAVKLPSTVKTIDVSAFYGCRRLGEIYLPKALETVNSRAFAGCVGLKKVTVSTPSVSINGDAFEGCISVTEVSLAEGMKYMPGFGDSEVMRTITLPSTLESLPLWLFKAMCGDSLQTVSFANTPARWDDLVQAEWEKYKIRPNARHYIETYPKEKVHFIAPPTTVTTTTVTTTVSTTVSTTATVTLPTEATSTQPTVTQTTATDRTTDTVVSTLPGVATTTVAVLPEADRPTGSSTVYWIIGGVAVLVVGAVAVSVIGLIKRKV